MDKNLVYISCFTIFTGGKEKMLQNNICNIFIYIFNYISVIKNGRKGLRSIHILVISVMLTADENRPPIISYKKTKIFNIF